MCHPQQWAFATADAAGGWLAALTSGCGPPAAAYLPGVLLATRLAFTTATAVASILTAAGHIADVGFRRRSRRSGQAFWELAGLGTVLTTGITVWAVLPL